MNNRKMKCWNEATTAVAAILIVSMLSVATAYAQQGDSPLDTAVKRALHDCQRISLSCANSTKNAAGILVFPKVTKADLILGGGGGKGALIENGQIGDYYNIGAASAGLQAGVEHSVQIYVFQNSQTLQKLKRGSDWKVGATADATLISSDSNATSATGNVLVYIFNAKGLNAGISLDVFDIWKADQNRPS